MLRSSVVLLAALLWISCGTSGNRSTSASSTTSAKGRQGDAPVASTVDVVKVVSRTLSLTIRIPGEIQPYENVAVYPKVTGFIEWIGVDRGSRVRKGELIARLVAPEITSQRAEAQAKLQSAEAQRIEAEAKLAADESTYQRLKAAAATPGVVSKNELEIAQKAAEADRARARALRDNVEAARQALRSIEEVEGYLQARAPIDGVVTERNVHSGALVGPVGAPGIAVPMVRIEQISRLRLVVPVPETYLAGIPEGSKVPFSVPAFPGESFTGSVARVAHSVDVKTRTMPVELDVMNPSGRLAPGMFPQVEWPVRRPHPTLFVPASALVRTTERVFVIRVRSGKAEWVDAKAGATSGNFVEVFGDLHEGDLVAVRGTDELRPDTPVTPRLLSSPGT